MHNFLITKIALFISILIVLMHVDVFTVQSSVITLILQVTDRPLYCLAVTPPAVSEFPPESLDRDTTPPRKKKSRLDRVMSSTS